MKKLVLKIGIRDMKTRAVLIIAFFLHLSFAIGELFPWDPPILLDRVVKKMNEEQNDDQDVLASPTDRKLVSIVVHNAGIYNVILAAGFLWAAFPSSFGDSLNEDATNALRFFFFCSATAAGLFGLTLSPLTAIQAVVGIVGIVCLRIDNRRATT